MKDPYIKIVIPAHDSESIRQYLQDYRFRFVVNDLLNLIRSELKHGPNKYDDPDYPEKLISLHRDTLRVIRKKLIDLADEYDLELD